jgi:hypothetical protein
MCLAMAGMYLGLGFLLNAVAPLVLFLPVFAVVDRRVIRWEERNLAAKFGALYLAHLSRGSSLAHSSARAPRLAEPWPLKPFRLPPPAPGARGRPDRSSDDESERPAPPS